MNLDEALAVLLTIQDLGYPNKDQRAALAEAERIIAQEAEKAIARFNSSAPG